MKIFFYIFICVCHDCLSVETMFNEHIEIMRDKENELIETEKNFLNKFTVFFNYETTKIPYKSFIQFAEDLYTQIMGKKLKSFTIAIEKYNFNIEIEYDSNFILKNIFEKIYKVLNDSSIDINEISPNNEFGLINRKEKVNIDKNDVETEKYEYLVKENFLNGYSDEISRHQNNFLIQKPHRLPHIFFFSDINLNIKDFELLLKIYKSKINYTNNSKQSIGCIVFEINKNKKKHLIDKFYNLCMSVKKKSFFRTIFSYLQHFNSTFFNLKNFENKSLLETSNLIFFNRSLTDKTKKNHKDTKNHQIKQKNPYQINLNFQYEFYFNSLNFFFSISKLEKASEKAKKTIKLFYPYTQLSQIYICTFQGLFEKQDLFLYKVFETFEVELLEVKTKIKKITIITFFEMGKHKQRFDFFYYKKMDDTLLTNYNADRVIKSQENFRIFLNNFKNILQSDFINFKININTFYYLFVNRTSDFPIIKCSFYNKPMISTDSYIEIVMYLYKTYQITNDKVLLTKFHCSNLKFLKESFYSLFEYKDQVILTNFQEVNQENIEYQKNTYFILKLKSNQKITLNLCILPNFEDEDFCKDIFNNKKNEIILIFKELIIKKKEMYLAKSDQMITDSNFLHFLSTEEHPPDDNNDIFKNESRCQDTINSISMVRILKSLNFDEFYMLFLNIYPLQFDLKEKFILDMFQNDIFYTNDFAKKCLADKDSSQTCQHFCLKKLI